MQAKKIIKIIIDICIKLLVALTIILWLLALFKPELIKDFIEWMRWIIYSLGYWNYIIIFITSLIESFPLLWVVVPGQNILLIVWGFFGEISMKNLYYVIFIASIWAILSNYIGYFLGIYYWERFVKKYGIWFWIGQTEVRYLEKWVKKWGAWGIILWKFHNLTRAFVPFIAGSMKMHPKSFFLYNIIGSTVRATVIVILWVVFAEYYETIIDYLQYILIWIMILTGVYIYKFKKKEFMQYMKEKNEEIENMVK